MELSSDTQKKDCYLHYEPKEAKERKCWACMRSPNGRECFQAWRLTQYAIVCRGT